MSAPLPAQAAMEEVPRSGQITAAATAFAALFAAVGIGLYGLTFFYDFFVKDFGWTPSGFCQLPRGTGSHHGR